MQQRPCSPAAWSKATKERRASSQVRGIWWLRLGIDIERIKPGHPQRNGRRERMHLTLKKEAIRPPGMNGLLAGQRLGIKEVDEGIWIVSFIRYALGFIGLEEKTLQPIDNPFGPRLSPMS